MTGDVGVLREEAAFRRSKIRPQGTRHAHPSHINPLHSHYLYRYVTRTHSRTDRDGDRERKPAASERRPRQDPSRTRQADAVLLVPLTDFLSLQHNAFRCLSH
jgi:hypothetical protein